MRGKAVYVFRFIVFPQDHPRLCGEKFPAVQLTRISLGSPPPMRGKGIDLYPEVPQKRITPAYAGKSQNGRRNNFDKRDHPRLCGEKTTRYSAASCKLGSPPPMRGKAPFSKSKPTFTRITPAYAGKSDPYCELIKLK